MWKLAWRCELHGGKKKKQPAQRLLSEKDDFLSLFIN